MIHDSLNVVILTGFFFIVLWNWDALFRQSHTKTGHTVTNGLSWLPILNQHAKLPKCGPTRALLVQIYVIGLQEKSWYTY